MSAFKKPKKAVYFADGEPTRSADEDLDEKLLDWVKDLRSRQFPVTRLMLKSKALKMKKNSPFKASNQWLNGYLKRSNLSRRKRTHEMQRLKASHEAYVADHFNELRKLRDEHDCLLIILGGCTSFLQPLDVSLNKPFKDCVRAQHTQWLTKTAEDAARYTTKAGYFKAPSYEDLMAWSLRATNQIEPQVIRNFFGLTGISMGLHSNFHLTKTLEDNFQDLITK